MLILSALVAFKDPMIRGSAIHIAYRILAAFFIVMGAKTSIVENLKFYQPIIDLWFCFKVVQLNSAGNHTIRFS